MKFGITPINFDILDESFDLRNLRFPLLVEKAINADYEHIEITMDLEYVLPGTLSKRIIKKLLRMKEETGISYSVHLPIWSIELSSPNAKIRNASVDCIIESINRTKILDPLAYVLHLNGALAAEMSRMDVDSTPKDIIVKLINGLSIISVEKILDHIDISPELIAVENIQFPFNATRKIIDKYNFSICFDTGHQLCGYSGKETVHEFLDRHMAKIIEYHLNDGKFMADGRPNDHIAVGDGNFPFDIIQRIMDSGFDGPAVFELTFAAAEKSLKRIRDRFQC